ncbi:CBS domain-containing protein (plasmid) [Ensifer adhaerens]|uniref:CBS domain-containing protein n=1 Tax=Ensifer adhaerens TaxID=106592 RepID=UPI001CBF18E3|nr:CBS domain-containing protein [Ensifer adhaerens]MBZ7927647.1 CBS domain-containing protein [Ensifer adhaerens]UAX98043.1 CBS domain-containing protein [Ensifer adhaerens]UAY05424.1 CBS domain-containing protein [Ensifer adhaerens]UAY12802.1 CBS domain-containing protein [Ensifer adhaerens]
MRIVDIMTRDVRVLSPEDTIATAAKEMAQNDVGFLPVADNDRLVGMITDRDIVIRCVAEDRDHTMRVGEIMTNDVKYCFEDEDVSDVAGNMGQQQVRRLPVVDHNKRLVGIVSLADAARRDPSVAGIGLRDVTGPGGAHNKRPH